MDLRHVVYRRDAIVKLRQSAEQLADVHVFRRVHGGEREQNVFEIRGGRGRRAWLVVNQDTVREKAAQRRLELVVVRIDEAGHDDLAARVDLRRAARVQVRADLLNQLTLDEHVGFGEFALVGHAGVHRHHMTAADDIAPATPAAVFRRVVALSCGRARREQTQACGGPACCRRLQEIAPPELRASMVLRESFIAQYAHLGFPSEVKVAIPRRVPRDFMVRPASMQIRLRPASSDRLGFDSSVAKCFREVVHKEGGMPLPTRAKWAGNPPTPRRERLSPEPL